MACFGLTRELNHQGVEVIFVLPKSQDTIGTPTFLFADTERKARGRSLVRSILSSLLPYHSTDSVVESIVGYDISGRPIVKKRTILEEVHRFAHQASLIAEEETFDVIHAHDWTSYLAGVAAKVASGKPLILHVHATSYDQAASNNIDPSMFAIECESFAAADTVVTVSNYTKRMIVERHGVDPQKVVVVHNGCDTSEPPRHAPRLSELKAQGKKVILYHGRITIQKGVDYFVKAARRVVDVQRVHRRVRYHWAWPR